MTVNDAIVEYATYFASHNVMPSSFEYRVHNVLDTELRDLTATYISLKELRRERRLAKYFAQFGVEA